MDPDEEKKPVETEPITSEQSVPDEDIKAIEKTEAATPVEEQPKKPLQHKFSWVQNLFSTKKRKIIAILVSVVVLVGLLIAIPASRYAIAGLVIKKDTDITVVDSITKKPVSGVTVMLGTSHADTSKDGVARFKNVPVGRYDMTLSKKYYKSGTSRHTVPILARADKTAKTIQATGRTVTVKVTNKITGKVLSDVAVEFVGTKTLTASSGIAEVVLAPGNKPQAAKVTKDGYNDTSLDIVVKNVDEQTAEVTLVPKGTVYFLSKRTGKINVTKSNLDGSNPQVVVEGTGREVDTETVLLASRDWKYLALLARREGNEAKLYLVDTSDGTLRTIDEGKVNFELVGWSGHHFVYKVNRNKNSWEAGSSALKSFNAETGSLKTLDETSARGASTWQYTTQYFTSAYITPNNQIVYAKYWTSNGAIDTSSNRRTINTVNTDGTNKKVVKEFDQPSYGYIDSKAYAPGEVYFRLAADDGTGAYFEYEDGAVKGINTVNDTQFYNSFYATYLLSPSGSKTFWYEPRDGKNVMFIGDNSGENGKEFGIADYTPYGWYSDEYVLFSKNSSELYIAGADSKLGETTKSVKVTDYHKPALTYPGYGYGYGGQ